MRKEFNLWEAALEKQAKIQAVLNDNDLVFFFSKGKEIYGAPETSRVIFARMRHPDEETSAAWVKEANLLAFNLGKVLQGDDGKVVFGAKELDDIKIIDQDKAETELMHVKVSDKKPDIDVPTDENPPNQKDLGEV